MASVEAAPAGGDTLFPVGRYIEELPPEELEWRERMEDLRISMAAGLAAKEGADVDLRLFDAAAKALPTQLNHTLHRIRNLCILLTNEVSMAWNPLALDPQEIRWKLMRELRDLAQVCAARDWAGALELAWFIQTIQTLHENYELHSQILAILEFLTDGAAERQQRAAM